MARCALGPCVAGLFLDEPEILFLFVQSYEERVAKHGGMQSAHSSRLPDVPDLGVQTDVAKWCTAFAPQEQVGRTGVCPIQPDKPQEGVHCVFREGDSSAGPAVAIANMEFRLTVMRRRIHDAQGTELLGLQARMQESQYDELIDYGTGSPRESRLARTSLDVRHELLHLSVRETRYYFLTHVVEVLRCH